MTAYNCEIQQNDGKQAKVNGSNFRLVEYEDKKGELHPCYVLAKTRSCA